MIRRAGLVIALLAAIGVVALLNPRFRSEDEGGLALAPGLPSISLGDPAEAALFGGGAAFPESEAGLVGMFQMTGVTVDLSASGLCIQQLEDVGSNFVRGTYGGYIKIYIDTDGWVVGYLQRGSTASRAFGSGVNPFLTNAFVGAVSCMTNQHSITLDPLDIGYYHLGYPTATEITILIPTSTNVDIAIPSGNIVHEVSSTNNGRLDGGGFSYSTPLTLTVDDPHSFSNLAVGWHIVIIHS